jgi:hypothetical protein
MRDDAKPSTFSLGRNRRKDEMGPCPLVSPPKGKGMCEDCRRDFPRKQLSTTNRCQACEKKLDIRIQAVQARVEREQLALIESGKAYYDHQGHIVEKESC